MKILLTNDDGIYAPGLRALYHELSGDYDVSVVAPESEMSAVGHSITLSSPLRVREIKLENNIYGFGVNGTPADCIKIAVQELLPSNPDIILSGINLGANVGINVLYSGTVSAATEGTFLGISSAALSLDCREEPDFSFAASFSRKIIQYIVDNNINSNIALNVNIPAVPGEEIKGIVLTKQNLAMHKEKYEKRVDPRGNIYYWLTGESSLEDAAMDSDTKALQQNMITITPISYDLTSFSELDRLRPVTLPDLGY